MSDTNALDIATRLPAVRIEILAELSITQPLYTFGKISAVEQALAELVGVRRAQAATAQWEIVTQATSAYYGLLLIGDLLALSNEVQGYVDSPGER